MPTTPHFTLRYPTGQSPAVPPADLFNLATDVDDALWSVKATADLTAGLQSQINLRSGFVPDQSLVLTGSDPRCSQSARTTILSASFTLGHQQIVGFCGKALLLADATSSAVASAGITVLVDGAVHDMSQDGPRDIGVPGDTTDRVTFVVPFFTVLLAAGAHTAALVVDRNSDGVINAKADATISAGSTRNYHPTYLGIFT